MAYEIDADGVIESLSEPILAKSSQDGRFSNPRIPNDQQLKKFLTHPY